MRLFELERNGELPTEAGKAKIKFDTCTNPWRKAETIYLPRNPSVELFFLKGGSQFLYWFNNQGYSEANQLWFGGTDEQPFLVRLQPTLFTDMNTKWKTEEDFFWSLVPSRTRKLAKRHLAENEKFTLRRQGDWFYTPMNVKWKDLETVWAASDRDLTVGTTSGEGQRLLQTRHVLKGELSNFDRFVFGQGTLEAEDHAKVEFKDTVYMLEQAANLYSPPEAD